MKSLILGAAFVLTLDGAVAQPRDDAAAIERLRQQITETEERLELFKRLIPAAFDLAGEREWIDRFAAKAELSPIDVKVIEGSERVRLPDGQPAPLEINSLEIAGRAPYDAVHFFLSMLRTRARLAGVDSLVFEAAPDDTVRFTARLAFLSWAETPPESLKLQERLARARATQETITAAVGRMQEHRIVDSLATFTEELEKEAVALTSVRIADGITIDGFLLGTAAGEAVRRGLAKGRLTASRFDQSPAGSCQSFSIVARRESSDGLDMSEAGFTPGRNVFDAESAAFCRTERQQPAMRVVAGDPHDDAFFLRLRDFDVADVFFVLNDLLDEDFLVDAGVNGRVDFVVDGDATLDDALRALAGTGLSIGPGPLRRVSRGGVATPAASGGDGEPVSFSMRDADLASVLCLSSQLSGRTIMIPAGTRGVVRLFATDVPLGVIIAAIAPKPSGAAIDACKAPGRPDSRLRKIVLASPPAIGDLRLAGIARVGEGWKAYAYAAGGRLVPINAGDRFSDGSAEKVSSTGVVFVEDAGGKIERRLER